MANYINAYANQAQYDADDTKQYPNVSLLRDSGTIVHVKEAPKPYLTFVAEEAGTFKFSGKSVNYSVDDGTTWSTLASNTDSPTVPVGGKIMFKATLIPNYGNGIGRFSSTGRFTAKGNPMCLLFGDDFEDKTSLNGKHDAFNKLFSNCTGLTSAENMSLQATTLAESCYHSMFSGCTSLTTVPALPATTLKSFCYTQMFYGCTSLTTAPVLPATTLANTCYYGMFDGCTSLTTAPELQATTLKSACYNSMFYGCTSLTTAPVLPATTLANDCYNSMFLNCTALTTAPVLSATTLANDCYRMMFQNCTSLINAPELPATTLTDNCYYQMFYGCRNLNSITCLATDISASNCTYRWAYSVASTGTFTKDPSMSSWTTDYNGIPTNWTVQDYQA